LASALKKAEIKAKFKANSFFSPYFSLGSRRKKADKAEPFFDSILAFSPEISTPNFL
jgi:hypothetical protein